MSVHLKKIKWCWLRPLRAVRRSGFDRFQPTGGHFVNFGSRRAHIHQPFQVPTDAFELQFQSVGFVPHIAYPPITCAPLPPGKDGFNFTPDRTEQPVGPHRCRAQLLPSAGLAQNPVGHAVLPAPFAAGLAPIGLVGHDHFLVALDHVFKFLAVMHVGRRQRDLPRRLLANRRIKPASSWRKPAQRRIKPAPSRCIPASSWNKPATPRRKPATS